MASEMVEYAAKELRETISAKLAELADMIMCQPALGSPEWFRERAKSAGYRAATKRDWHLLKTSIAAAAKVDPTGDVINARLYGASWQQLGAALGTSKQAAHERWSGTCERSATRVESEADVLAAADHNRTVADAEDEPASQV